MKQTEGIIPANKNNGSPDTCLRDQINGTGVLSHQLNLPGRVPGIRSVNVTFDNRFLIITFEHSPAIRILDLEKLEYLQPDYSGHTNSVRQTAISRDNKSFYSASWDGSSRKFDLQSGKCIEIFSGFGRSPSCFLDPSEKYLFTASYDSEIELDGKNTGRCWEISTGKTINLYKHLDTLTQNEAMDIVYDGNGVYTGSDDGRAFRWKLEGEQPDLIYFTFKGTVRKLAVSKQYLAAACTDGVIRIHHKLSGERFREINRIGKEIRDIKISEDEARIWCSTGTGSVSCHQIPNGEILFHKNLSPFWIWSICLLNDERILVCGIGDGSIKFLRSDTGQVLATLHAFPDNKDILITSPPDKTFPNGFFYTSNPALINVMKNNPIRKIREKLDPNDPRRIEYMDSLNLKSLMVTRLKNFRNYESLISRYTPKRHSTIDQERILMIGMVNSRDH